MPNQKVRTRESAHAGDAAPNGSPLDTTFGPAGSSCIEAQLRRTQKMEAVGALAGGVAHDFNNLLTVIRIHAEFLRDAFGEGVEERADAEEIIHATDRAAGLTAHLLAFGRKRVLQPVALDVATVVTELEPLLRRVIAGNVALTTITPPVPASVIADRGLIEQVLINLVVNARNAMPEGGSIIIETSATTIDGALEPVRRGEIAPGAYIVLSVWYEATAIAGTLDATVDGAELGMATVYEIVDQVGGGATVERDGDGSVAARVYLPFAANAEATELPWPARLGETHGGETILLVDDEAAVRAIAHRVLQAHGYRVLVARHGADALRLAAEHAGRIHLVLADMFLPELGGRELIERMRQVRPDIVVVCMSGYTHMELGPGNLPAAASFLAKPFGERELAMIVRRTLDQANARRATGI